MQQRRRLVALLASVGSSQHVVCRHVSGSPVAEGSPITSRPPATAALPLNGSAPYSVLVARRDTLARLLERSSDAIADPTTFATTTTSSSSTTTELTVLGVPCRVCASPMVADKAGTTTTTTHAKAAGEGEAEDATAAMDRFAQAFSVTLHAMDQHPNARALERAGSPTSAGGGVPVSAVAVATTALTLGPARQAHVLERLTSVQQLLLACTSLCRRAWRQHATHAAASSTPSSSSSSPAARLAESLLAATATATKPTGIELRYRRRVLGQHLRQELGSETAAEMFLSGHSEAVEATASVSPKTRRALETMVTRALFSGACDTSTSVLGRVTLQLFLARELLECADTADTTSMAEAAEERRFLRQVGQAMLVQLTTCRYRLDRISARDGVRTHTFSGLDELLRTLLFSLDEEHSKLHRRGVVASDWQSMADDGESEAGRQEHRRYRSVVRTHLRTFLGLYSALLPQTVAAVVAADAEAKGVSGRVAATCEGGTTAEDEAGTPSVRASTHVVRVVETLKHSWRNGARKVRVEGPSPAALWWLQTAAVCMEAFAACSEQLLRLAACDAATTAAAGVATAAEVVLLTRVRTELSDLLRDLFHYDRSIYAHYQRLTEATEAPAPRAGEHDGASDGEGGDNSSSNNPGTAPLPLARRRGRRTLFQVETESTKHADGHASTAVGGASTASASAAGDSAVESVLRPAAVTSASLGDVQQRGARRFVARNRALLQDGLGTTNQTALDASLLAAAANATAAAAAAAAAAGKRSRKKKGADAAAEASQQPSVGETEQAFSALFHIFVLLRTTPGALASRYGITHDRSDELEETWLNVLRARQRLEDVVMSPPAAHEAALAQQRRLCFQHTAAAAFADARAAHTAKAKTAKAKTAKAQHKGDDAVLAADSALYHRLVAVLEPSAVEAHLPRRVQRVLDDARAALLLRALGALPSARADPSAALAEWEAALQRVQHATVSAVDAVGQALPPTTLDSALLITNRLTEALLLVVDRSEDISSTPTAAHNGHGTVASRYRTVLQGSRRTLLTVLTIGAQEVVLGNRAVGDGVAAAWWFRRLALVPYAHVSEAAHALGVSRRLGSASAALQSRHRLLTLDERLQRLEEAIECLERSAVPAGGAEEDRSFIAPVALDLPTRQALVAAALSQLLATGHVLRLGGGGSGGGGGGNRAEVARQRALASGMDVSAADLATAHARAQQANGRLAALLQRDAELVLVSSFAAGLTAWREVSRVFAHTSSSSSGGGSSVDGTPSSTGSLVTSILPVSLSAIMASLAQSRQDDDPSTHASVCEHALLTLSGLCELALSVSLHDASSEAALDSHWRTALARVCTYCMGWAVRDAGTASSTADDQAAVYAALYARYTLPLAHVPWQSALTQRLPRASPLRALLCLTDAPCRSANAHGLCAGSYLLLLDHSSRLLSSELHHRPYHTTLQERSVEALREVQHRFRTSASADALEALGSGTSSPSATLKARLHAQQRRGQAWQAWRDVLVRRAAPLAAFAVTDMSQAHALHPLVRFVESHASSQLIHSTRRLTATTTATSGISGGARTSSSSSRLAGAVGSVAVAREVHGTAFLLLRFVEDLYRSHSWMMLCVVFRAAQLAQRAESILGAHETTPLRVAGLSATLGLLQEMPCPRAGVRLRPTFLTVLQRLADMLSASSTTLLGMRNSAAVRGWLARPNRDVYRSAIFGVKQTVLYVQREATWFCAQAAARQAETLAVLDDDDDDDDSAPAGSVRAAYYTKTYRAGRESASLTKEFVLFVAILRSAQELVLECVRHHALQQRVIDAELTGILTACYDVLCQLFCDATHTLLREVAEQETDASPALANEQGVLLLAGLSLVASANVVQQHDPAGIFFRDRTQHQSAAVVAAVEALLDATPVLHTALQTAWTHFINSGIYTRDLSWRLGTILYGRSDMTVLIVALSTFADTAMRQPDAARLYWKAWHRLQRELRQQHEQQVTSDDGEDMSSTSSKKKRAQTAKRKPVKGKGRAGAPAAFRVPSHEEFVLAVSAFNELNARYQQTHSDVQSLEGGVGVFAPVQAGHTRDTAMATAATEAMVATADKDARVALDWSCDPSALAAAVVVVEPAAWRTRTGAVGADTELELVADEDGEGSSLAPSTRPGGPQPVGLGFHTHVDVAEAAAEGVLSADEIIGAVIQQSRELGLVSGALTVQGTSTSDGGGSGTVVNGMTPHVRAAMESYLRNLLAIFELYPLAQVCAHPAGATTLFRLLEPWLALRETSELASVAHGTATKLWRLLAAKFRSEAIAPHEAAFTTLQTQLLRAVYVSRTAESSSSSSSSSARSPMSGLGTPDDNNNNSSRDVFFVPGWFSSAARDAAAGLYAPADMVELSASDDVRAFLPDTPAAVASSPAYTRKEACCTPVFPTVVPLEVTMVLLRALLRGDRRVSEVRELADSVATYASRQYVLLRARLGDSALNVLSVLLAEPDVRAAVLGAPLHASVDTTHSKPHASASALPESRLWIGLGLPMRSAHSNRISGALFTDDKSQALAACFATAGLSVTKDAGGSTEEAVFDYMRAAALYLKLLSTIASVLLRYKLFGDLVEDSVRALLYGRTVHMDGETGKPHSSAAAGSLENVALSPLQRQLARQTQPALVNRNTFESVMLHYLNVGLTLTRHADAVYHAAADRALDLAAGPLAPTTAERSGVPSVAPVDGDALMAYAEEVRHLVADAVQGTLSTLGFLAGRTDLTHVRCAAHHLISGCTCDPLALQTSQVAFAAAHPGLGTSAAVAQAFAARQGRLHHLVQQHPAVSVGSPTMLAVLTPSYFERSLTYTMPRAQSTAITPIAASFGFYMQQRHVALAPLLAAVAELLASTPVRNSAQKMLCEKLARALLERPDFRLALAPPTVASSTRSRTGHDDGEMSSTALSHASSSISSSGGGGGGAGPSSASALPNEVLIPFLAAMTRGDVQITKTTLAELLHTAMRMRADVFGEPPIAARQAKLSLMRGGGVQHIGGSFDLSNPLYARRKPEAVTSTAAGTGAGADPLGGAVLAAEPFTPATVEGTDALPSDVQAAQSKRDLALLEGFSASTRSDSASATHRRALASLNLSLSAAMEVAMHLGASRALAKPEAVRARSLLRAADDARRERVGSYRSLMHAATVTGHAKPGDTAPVQPVLDAALHLEDPKDYGVAVMHVQFALRKVVHAAFRRLGPHQTPASLAMMTDMLYAIDSGFRARREADPVGGAQPRCGTSSSSSSSSLSSTRSASSRLDFPLDPMLASTIRVLLSRARLSAQAVGYAANGAPQRYLTVSAGLAGSDHDDGLARGARSQPVLFPLTATGLVSVTSTAVDSLAALEGDKRDPQNLQLRQTLEEEAGVSVALTTSVMPASAKMKMRQAVRAALRQSRTAQAKRRKQQQQRTSRTKMN